MGKLTGRSAIVTADVDEDLLIHVVDTAGTPASFKATLSQLYAVFPKNSSAGAGDVNKVPKWTATNELGASIIEDNGSKATISGVLSLEGTGAGKLNLVNTVAQDTSGSNYMNWYESDGTSRRGYLGFTDPNTFNINVQESAGTSQIVLDADEIIFNSVSGTDSSTITTGVWEGTAIADAYIASAATWNAKADISATPANNQVAVWTNGTTIEGDSNFTWDGFEIEVTDADNNLTEVRPDWLRVYNETDDANLFLYGYGTGHRGEIVLGAANGTRGGETATLSGNTVATISAFGHSGTVFRQGGQAIFAATENYTEGSAYGTRFVLQTVADGSTTLVTRYATDGDGNHSFNGNVKVDGQAYSAKQTTTYTPTGSFQIDWDLGNVAVVDLGSASGTINVGFTNQKAGANYFIKVIQHATTPVDLSWPATGGGGGTYWPSDTPPVISTGANAVDGIALTCISANELLANFSQDYQ
jgi:hypothetical protein